MKKKLITITLAAIMAIGASMPTVMAKNSPYPDCNNEAVTELSDMGILSGDENGNFRPDSLLTRAEFSTMVSIATGIKETMKPTDFPYESQFSDITRDYWGFEYITYCSNNAYIDGFEDGTFRPDENITLAQALKICLSAIGYDAMINKNTETSVWYEQWLDIAYDYKLITKSVNAPDRAITRLEAAELIYKTVNMPLCIAKGFKIVDGKGVADFKLYDGKTDENGETVPLETLYTKYIQ